MILKNEQKTFVKPDGTAIIICPNCELAKTVAVGKFRSQRHIIKVRCTCGHTFPLSLDFRKSYRKKTALPAIYETHVPGADIKRGEKSKLAGIHTMQALAPGSGHIQVTNISAGGLQFTTADNHSFEVGQKAQITFTLDDRKKTEINKLVIVQSVTDNIIGCRFASNEPLEQGLRFYLFP
jgi:hypothetical protein